MHAVEGGSGAEMSGNDGSTSKPLNRSGARQPAPW